MPPRLNKRQLREQVELEELEKARAAVNDFGSDEQEIEGEQDDGNDDDDTTVATTAATTMGQARLPISGFGALKLGDEDADKQDGDDDDQGDEEEERPIQAAVATTKKSKNKKKKKKTAGATAASTNCASDSPSAIATPSDSTPAVSTPTSSKKGKNAKSVTNEETTNDMDEIDRALAELAAKGGPSLATIEAQQQSAQLDKKYQAIKQVFSFDTKLLDGDAELRKFFGSKIIQHTQSNPRSPHHARFANNPHHSTSIKRTASYLANPEPGWLPATGVLKLERYEGPEAQNDPSGEWWSYVHTPEYRIAQMSFLEVLQQADGNRLFSILQSQPYHIDTHLQLAEMLSQQGDLTASSQHLARALYAMSAPLPPSFTSGSFRLSYNKIENRAFFIAVARNVAIQTKRGTWRTATEWAKIALGCSGGTDPMGMLCFLDFLAPKSGQNESFLSMLEELPKAYPHQKEMQVELYPGLTYARALCLRHSLDPSSEAANEALESAILRFPMVVSLLLSTLGGNAAPALVTDARSQVDGAYTPNASYLTSLLSSLYAHRSAPLWKEPSLLSWLTSTATRISPTLSNSSHPDVIFGLKAFSAQLGWSKGEAPQGVIRAVFLSDVPSLRPYLPPSVLGHGEAMYSYDPLPPRGPEATTYDDAYFQVLHQTSVGRRLRSARQPQRGGPGTARGLAAQLAALLGMGEGGGAIDMNDELRRELMDELAMIQGGGVVPGGFPGLEDDEEDEQE